MSEDFVYKSLPARTRFFIFEGTKRRTFVENPGAAIFAWKKNRGKGGKNVLRGLDTISPAHGTLHAASYDLPVIETFSIYFCHLWSETSKKILGKSYYSGPEGIRTHDRPVMSRAL